MAAFTLRLPPTLHACLIKLAKDDGRSLQMWIQRKLEKEVPEGMMAATALKELRAKNRSK